MGERFRLLVVLSAAVIAAALPVRAAGPDLQTVLDRATAHVAPPMASQAGT